MAEEPSESQDEDVAAEGAEEKPSGKKKLILFGLVGVLVLGAAGGGAAYFLGMFDGAQSETETAAAPEPVYFYELPQVTVNLSTIDERTSYLKMRVALELSNESLVKQIEPMMPRILDAFQVYLRELRTTDIRGSSGLFRLKEELQRRINIAVYPAKVNDVLFKELLVQ